MMHAVVERAVAVAGGAAADASSAAAGAAAETAAGAAAETAAGPLDVWLSLERNMACAAGFCGLCQFGPEFVCRDGPVFRHDRIARFLAIRHL